MELYQKNCKSYMETDKSGNTTILKSHLERDVFMARQVVRNSVKRMFVRERPLQLIYNELQTTNNRRNEQNRNELLSIHQQHEQLGRIPGHVGKKEKTVVENRNDE